MNCITKLHVQSGKNKQQQQIKNKSTNRWAFELNGNVNDRSAPSEMRSRFSRERIDVRRERENLGGRLIRRAVSGSREPSNQRQKALKAEEVGVVNEMPESCSPIRWRNMRGCSVDMWDPCDSQLWRGSSASPPRWHMQTHKHECASYSGGIKHTAGRATRHVTNQRKLSNSRIPH